MQWGALEGGQQGYDQQQCNGESSQVHALSPRCGCFSVSRQQVLLPDHPGVSWKIQGQSFVPGSAHHLIARPLPDIFPPRLALGQILFDLRNRLREDPGNDCRLALAISGRDHGRSDVENGSTHRFFYDLVDFPKKPKNRGGYRFGVSSRTDISFQDFI